MTSDAKRALSRTIRELRRRLIDDLGEATERAYRLSIDAKKASLDEASRVQRARLESWIDEQVRASGKRDSGARLRADVVKDAAATFLQRIVYLRLLEASGLRSEKIVTGGWESKGYKDFREAAPELVRPSSANETEGYATLLQLVFDELALELPGLYGPVRMTPLVPIPASTLRALITALDAAELSSVWTDDTTLGWIYQYWNDPEREALDAKLDASKKLENHEIASKTQMFTERYMVEWLLHNSLGQMWLAMCRKHGWTADVERDGVLGRLEARRIAWREKREAGEVALDELMPIEPGLEDRWKYWVLQPMPDDAVSSAPDSLRTLKLLDPTCGSGHFLVIACELLFFLHREEAHHRREKWSDREIVESIVENNLHGIDIDPRAVQIAAAALMFKARQLCAEAEPRTMNLVAPNLSLSALDESDPARVALCSAIEHETGIPPELTGAVLTALTGADHLGTLLKVDTEIDAAIATWDAELSRSVPDQGTLFEGFGPRRRTRIAAEQAKKTMMARLDGFLEHHTGGPDLGLRLRGEQLAAGVRFVRMVHEGQYDIVVGNPPYQSTSKMVDSSYVEHHYPRGKADLYAAFLERGLQLAIAGGISALLTMRNWMFLKQFSAMRTWLLEANESRIIGDVDRGAFDEVPNEVLAAAMSIFCKVTPGRAHNTIVMQPTALTDKSYDRDRTKRKRSAVLAQVGRFECQFETLKVVPQWPLVYWWPTSLLDTYARGGTLGTVAPAKAGLQTSCDPRFLRNPWELPLASVLVSRKEGERADATVSWVPLIKGADGKAWIEPLSACVAWKNSGLELRTFQKAYLRNMDVYFRLGVAFTDTGSDFSARLHRFIGIPGDKGPSFFSTQPSPSEVVCLLNSQVARDVVVSLNPGLDFQVGDVNRVPILSVEGSASIVSTLEASFAEHESHRETSVEYQRPGPSSWAYTQAWAQRSVDRANGTSLPLFAPEFRAEPSSDHISFAVGVALGRFDATGSGSMPRAPAGALPHGVLFLSEATEADSLAHSAAAAIHEAWLKHRGETEETGDVKSYLRTRFFSSVHRKMYDNRPVYFPLSSRKKSFVAFVSIHRWAAGTLNDLLADHLYPTKKILDGEQVDLREVRDGADKKAARAAEKRFGQIAKWLEELVEFIENVEQCAERGPPSPDGSTNSREVDARYQHELGDGVMVNSAALWPLLEPQWSHPKQWWTDLANAEGKKDCDWAHLAKRYFPSRVDAKCKIDPSLAVAHGCFWKYHPSKAYQWELRLQDEIRPDFTLDEVGSDATRAAFQAEHPDEVEALVTKEHLRRQRKLAKSGEATGGDEPQGELELNDNAGEELSA